MRGPGGFRSRASTQRSSTPATRTCGISATRAGPWRTRPTLPDPMSSCGRVTLGCPRHPRRAGVGLRSRRPGLDRRSSDVAPRASDRAERGGIRARGGPRRCRRGPGGGDQVAGVYETPGGTILLTALQELEQLVLSRSSLALKDALAPRYADLVYEGRWWTPEREAIDATVDSLMANVTGTVRLRLFKGQATVLARQAPVSLYDLDLGVLRRLGGLRARRRVRLREAVHSSPARGGGAAACGSRAHGRERPRRAGGRAQTCPVYTAASGASDGAARCVHHNLAARRRGGARPGRLTLAGQPSHPGSGAPRDRAAHALWGGRFEDGSCRRDGGAEPVP